MLDLDAKDYRSAAENLEAAFELAAAVRSPALDLDLIETRANLRESTEDFGGSVRDYGTILARTPKTDHMHFRASFGRCVLP